MLTLNVAIKDGAQLKDIVGKASRVPFDINLAYGSILVDVKSIMGVMYLGINKMLRLEANTVDGTALKNAMKDYVVI